MKRRLGISDDGFGRPFDNGSQGVVDEDRLPGLVVVPDDRAQEITSRIGGEDAQFVLEAHLGIEQAPATQPLDTRPAAVLQFLVVMALVLAAEEQDIEIGTQQAAAHGLEVLVIIEEGVVFQFLADFQHIGAPGREIVQDAVLALTVAVHDLSDFDYLVTFFQ